MHNTVLEENTDTAIVEDLRLQTNHELNVSKVFILVEGNDDKKVYQQFFNEKVEFSIAGNCLKVVESMVLISQDLQLQNRVIGIKDADFDHLTRKESATPTLFLTDTHDAETLILTSCSVVRKICMEIIGKYEDSVMSMAIKNIFPLSFLRYYNEVKVLSMPDADGINFNGFKVSCNTRGEEKDECFWLAKVGEHGGNSTKKYFPSVETFKSFIKDNEIKNCDVMKFVNGHDLITSLRIVIGNMEGITKSAQGYGDKDIVRLARAAYGKDDFTHTCLFKSIGHWANAHDVDIWWKVS